MRNLKCFWSEFRLMPGIAQFGGWLVVVMVVLLACFPGPANAAERTARAGDDSVTIQDRACVHGETLARIPPDQRKLYGMARGRFQGQDFFGCWKPIGNAVVIQWEDGDTGVIPLSQLKEAADI